MSIEPVNNISFNFQGGISKEHTRIISELLALGIQPTYNYAIDKAKLKAAKSEKMAKMLHKDKIKKESGIDAKNKEIKETTNTKQNSYDIKLDHEFLGTAYIASINKTFIKRTNKKRE